MTYRWIEYWDPERGAMQISLAILDDVWDALLEITLPVGPFDDPCAVRDDLLHRTSEWLLANGVQGELPL